MSIFDRFKPKPKAPEGFAEINVEFTADENEAINRTLETSPTEPNLIEQADLLGRSLVGSATESASFIMKELGKRSNIRFRDQQSERQFLIEVIVFYMHLVDRLAFAYLETPRRAIFVNRLSAATVSAGGCGEALQDTFNRRQMEYGKHKAPIPKKDEPLTGALYGEFSKILFALVDDHDPATLTFLNLIVTDVTKAKFYDSLNAEEALNSLAQRPRVYENPIDQVMFILGFKCDPKFDTFVHALMHGANPGIMDIAEILTIEAAILGNLRACAKIVRELPDYPSALKEDIYQLIVKSLDETHFGGRWFENTQLPSDDWVNMGKYSPLFVRGSRVFCLPVPYFRILASII